MTIKIFLFKKKICFKGAPLWLKPKEGGGRDFFEN